ncbi:MAG: YesL family protein [Bariatricus sp.]
MKFNPNNPVFQFLETLTDFVVLNLTFLVTCIPIITIGPALCALYSVTLREARGEQGYMFRPYLTAFKKNLKNGTALFAIYVFAGAVLIYNFAFWTQVHMFLGNVILVILSFCAVIYILSLCYVFALSARFENTIRQTIKNSVLIALSHLKQTGILILLLLLPLVLAYISAVFKIFLTIFGFAFLAYCRSFPLVKVFEQYEPTAKSDESAATDL